MSNAIQQLIEYLNTKGKDSLKEEFGVEIKEYDCGYLVFNYSQIDSPKNVPMVNACRGLILDSNNQIVCRPFGRFFNYGEADTKEFDFSDVTIFEKADGSMVKVYWSHATSRWEIGTRGTAFAESDHGGSIKYATFRDGILDAMNLTEDEFQNVFEWKHKTFILEYCSPWNRIVTPYDKPQVVLLAVIDNTTGYDAFYDRLNQWCGILSEKGLNVRMPQVYQANGADEIVKLAESLDGLKEGFVVYDNKTGRRVKVKSATYCAVHHLRGNGTPSQDRLMEVVLLNEQDELISYFPEFKEFIDPIEAALHQLTEEANAIYGQFANVETQKDFALAVKDTKVAPVCFKARKDKVSAHHAFVDMEMNQKKKLLEKYLNV